MPIGTRPCRQGQRPGLGDTRPVWPWQTDGEELSAGDSGSWKRAPWAAWHVRRRPQRDPGPAPWPGARGSRGFAIRAPVRVSGDRSHTCPPRLAPAGARKALTSTCRRVASDVSALPAPTRPSLASLTRLKANRRCLRPPPAGPGACDQTDPSLLEPGPPVLGIAQCWSRRVAVPRRSAVARRAPGCSGDDLSSGTFLETEWEENCWVSWERKARGALQIVPAPSLRHRAGSAIQSRPPFPRQTRAGLVARLLPPPPAMPWAPRPPGPTRGPDRHLLPHRRPSPERGAALPRLLRARRP